MPKGCCMVAEREWGAGVNVVCLPEWSNAGGVLCEGCAAVVRITLS